MQKGQQENLVRRLEKGSGRWSREPTRTINQHLWNKCDTRIKYVQDHYFQYDAKRATDALATGRGQLKGASGTDWMRDPYVHDS